MPTINVVINNQKVCIAGDLDTSFLSASLVSAIQGPMVLRIHELRSDDSGGDKIVTWHNEIFQVGDKITLSLTESDNANVPPPESPFNPKIQARNSIFWIIGIDGSERVRASLKGFDQIQAQLTWRRGEECVVKIGSVNWDNDECQLWLEETLGLGSRISFLIAE